MIMTILIILIIMIIVMIIIMIMIMIIIMITLVLDAFKNKRVTATPRLVPTSDASGV